MEKNNKEIQLEMLKIAEPDILARARSTYIKGMESEDIAQEMRIKVFQAASSYDKNKALMRTFINTIIRNCLIDLSRKVNRDKRKCLTNSISVEDLNYDLEDKDWEFKFEKGYFRDF